MTIKTERYKKGLKVFTTNLGPEAKKYAEGLEKIYPKFARVNMEFPFGDLYSDTKILDAHTRELITIGALTVLGYGLPQLEVHIKAALHCGASREEILETITQMLAYGGFPSATNALLTADKVFKEIDNKPKKKKKS